MFHRLHLLITNKGGVANLRGLGPSGPGQGRCSHPLTRVGRPLSPANSWLRSNAQASC